MPEIDNPYWAAIGRLVAAKLVVMDDGTKTIRPVRGQEMFLNALRSTHSRTITDPKLVDWVAGMCSEEVVELDAGLALWSRVLHQYGKKVTAYDLNPAHPNHYPTAQMDRLRSRLRVHGDATLICMSTTHPHKSLLLALKRFSGRRLVIGADPNLEESEQLWAVLDREWDLVDKRFGYCRLDELREVFVFDKRRTGRAQVAADWNDEPTQLIPIMVTADE